MEERSKPLLTLPPPPPIKVMFLSLSVHFWEKNPAKNSKIAKSMHSLAQTITLDKLGQSFFSSLQMSPTFELILPDETMSPQ